MSDLDKLLPHVMDIKESLGMLNAEVRATNAHLESVSRKSDSVRGDLNNHKDDLEAHGIKAKRQGIKDLWVWICAIASVVATLYTIYKKGHP